MNPLKKLIKEIRGPSDTTGRIVATSGRTMTVMTRNGAVIVERDTLSTYSAGDEVQLVNGQVVGKLRKAHSLPVHYV